MRKKPGEETRIRNDILDWLLVQPFVLLVKHNVKKSIRGRRVVSRYYPAGFPDIDGILIGARPFFIEVKTQTGRVSKDQEDFIGARIKDGCVAFVSKSVEDTEAQLKAEGYS